MLVNGCMTAYEVEYPARIDGRLDLELYCKLSDDELMQTLEYYEMEKVYFNKKMTLNSLQEKPINV